MPVDVGAIFEKAVALHQAGDLIAAEALYRDVLAAQADHWNALYLLGTALLQLGRFDESIEFLKHVSEKRRDVPDAGNNLGIAYKAMGRWDEAARAFEATMGAHPQYDQAFFNLGTLLQERGKAADAEQVFRRGLAVNPVDLAMRHGLAKTLKAQSKWDDASNCYRQVVETNSQNVDAAVDLGFVLIKQGHLDQAAAEFHRILEIRPDYGEVHSNLSYLYERQGELERAAAAARRAIELSPSSANAYNNLGTALRSLHQFDEACQSFQRAVELRPGFALADFNLGTTHLLLGDFKKGWAGYEGRHEIGENPDRAFSLPRWEGQSIEGCTLLVYWDQGFGDTIQFVRFLKQTKSNSGATVILECQPELYGLMSEVPGADRTVACGDMLPQCDYQIALASLPAVLEVQLQAIPAEVPYLPTQLGLKADLQERLNRARPGELKVGIAWQGSPQQGRDFVRSCPLATLLPLAYVPGISLFSLQVGGIGPRERELLEQTAAIVDLGTRFQDFSDTAAVLTRLDLVITVDTAVSHLAGALGRPVWTLLCHTPDWRWLLERTDCPWYPTMQLFRQPKWGDWETVVDRVKHALSEFVESSA